MTDGIKFKSKASEKAGCNNFILQKRQANAILDMRLYKLIGLEIEALQNEHEDDNEKHCYFIKIS